MVLVPLQLVAVVVKGMDVLQVAVVVKGMVVVFLLLLLVLVRAVAKGAVAVIRCGHRRRHRR